MIDLKINIEEYLDEKHMELTNLYQNYSYDSPQWQEVDNLEELMLKVGKYIDNDYLLLKRAKNGIFEVYEINEEIHKIFEKYEREN